MENYHTEYCSGNSNDEGHDSKKQKKAVLSLTKITDTKIEMEKLRKISNYLLH